MHGLAITSSNGYKTRPFDNILSEQNSFEIIQQKELMLAVAFRDSQDVTECLGGAQAINEVSLGDSTIHTVIHG